MSKVVLDTSHLNRIVEGLKGFEKEMPKAYVSALNRTLDRVYSRVGSNVIEHYKVSSKEIKQSLTKNKASYSRPRAFIRIRSSRYALGRFLRGGLKSTAKKARVKVKKAAGFKPVGGDPVAFVQKTPDGNTHVMRRRGKGRYPIDVLRTISPTQMVENLDVMDKIMKDAGETLQKRVEHEINYRLKKVRGN